MSSLKMLYDYVLIKSSNEEESSSPIVLPDSAKKKTTIGVVVAVGSGARDADGKCICSTVKVGDKVLYRQWAGTEVEVDGEKMITMKESDIYAIFE
mgnify:CR=1 FL=1